MRKKKEPRYIVYCNVCYHSVILEVNNKEGANRAVTGHMHAYGHSVGIIDRKRVNEQAEAPNP